MMPSVRRIPPLVWIAIVIIGGSFPGLEVKSRCTQRRIINQAAISYEDKSGRLYRTTSNQVVIIFSGRFGLSIQPDGTSSDPLRVEPAQPGQEITVPYTLINTGNTKDSFLLVPVYDDSASDFTPRLSNGSSGINIIKDEDRNGTVGLEDTILSKWMDLNGNQVVDPSEVEQNLLGPCPPGEIVNILVNYHFPDQVFGGSLYVGIDGFSTHNGSVLSETQEHDLHNIHQSIIDSGPSLSITTDCSTNFVNVGQTYSVDIRATNTGTSDAEAQSFDVDGGEKNYEGVMLYYLLPTYDGGATVELASSPTGFNSVSNMVGTILYARPSVVDSAPNQWEWSTTYSPGDRAIGYLTKKLQVFYPTDSSVDSSFIGGGTNGGDSENNLPAGGVMSLNFLLSIPADYSKQLIHNKGYVSYSNRGWEYLTDSNDAIVTVAPSASVLLTDTDYLNLDPYYNPPPDGEGRSNDSTTYQICSSGTSIRFTNQVINQGTVEDTFELYVTQSSSIPHDWTVSFYDSSGSIPLSDSDNDGNIDSGSIEPGRAKNVVVELIIPEDFSNSNKGWQLVIRAESSVDRRQSDITTNLVQTVANGEFELSLARRCQTESLILKPGESEVFSLAISHNSLASETFILSTLNSPDFLRIQYYLDRDHDFHLDSSEKLPITAVNLDGDESNYILVRVNYLRGSTTQRRVDLGFVATCNSKSVGSEVVWVSLQLVSACGVAVNKGLATTVPRGGRGQFTHVLTNLADDDTEVELSISNSGELGWLRVAYGEAGAKYSKGDPILDLDQDGRLEIRDLEGNCSLPIIVTFVVPSNLIPRIITINLNVWAEACSRVTVTDVVYTQAPRLKLIQDYYAVDLNNDGQSQGPGDQIVYSTSYRNLSVEAINQITLLEPISPHTSFVVGSVNTGTPPANMQIEVFFSSDDGQNWGYVPRANPNGIDPKVTTIKFRFYGELPAGSRAPEGLSYSVRINQ